MVGMALTTAAVSTARAGVYALDGDDLMHYGQDYRFVGVDAPELDQWCGGERGVPYQCGVNAKAALDSIVSVRSVSCVPIKSDGQRFIGSCTAPGIDIEVELVRSGWLWCAPTSSAIPQG
jgi:endonuclease YncB( thermonuclease family)